MRSNKPVRTAITAFIIILLCRDSPALALSVNDGIIIGNECVTNRDVVGVSRPRSL